MIPKTLTIIERQTLANQFRILAKIYYDDSFMTKAEIVENGYTGRYYDVFNVEPEEVPLEICEETEKILNMYRRINNAIARLQSEEKESLDLEKIEFKGFDANNDPHYHYMTFMVEKMGLWEEYKGHYLNSHSQAPLMKYRRMLKYQKELLDRKKYELDIDDLKHMIEIA